MAREECRILRTERLLDFGARPDVEFPLLAFRIGVERGAEGAVRGGHLARQPFDGLSRAVTEQGSLRAGECEAQQLQQLRVVIEHLFEMRHEPALVDRIAGKAAAEMIVDSTVADALEGQLDEAEVTGVSGALAGPPQQLEKGG